MSDAPIIDDLNLESVKPVTEPSRRPATAKRKSKPAPAYRQRALVEPLTKVYAMFGLGMMPFAPRTASALVESAEACAETWDEWAATSPAVRKLLYPLLNVSGGAKVFAAHLPIAAAAFMEMAPGSRLADQVERYLRMVTPDGDSATASE